MSLKSLIAIAAITVAATFGTAATAQANPNVGFSIGFGFGDMPPAWDDDFGLPQRPHHFGHNRPHRPAYRSVNCKQAKRIVHMQGFEDIRAVKCTGPVFAFEAWREDDLFRIRVDARGRIVRVSPIYAHIQ